ncbi:MAG: hypothetical protein JST21_15830 [Bacteroidetes bacterium]|nr:hypothetical protein [Bacteroidota bacterium]
MKYRWLFAILFATSSLSAQNITGVWRGTFHSGIGPFSQTYKYEVQIDQLPNNSLKGVTYSYLTTVFYGKASFQGIWFPKSKNAIVKELKLIELRMAQGSDACAMTCNLIYSKDGNKETLQGTFTSVNTDTKADCGSGTVYLEKELESDFHKEDFLLKKSPTTTPPSKNKIIPNTATKTVTNTITKTNAKKLQNALGVPDDGVVGPKTMTALKKKLPDFNDKLDLNNTTQVNKLIDQIKKANTSTAQKTITQKPQVQNKVQPPVANNKDSVVKTPANPSAQTKVSPVPEKKNIPVPDVIKKRSNPLLKTITTNSPDIKIELYDNGEIDGDTITVYDNNRVIAWKQGLTKNPITLNIKADTENPVHEFVMVADNLGSIPPNTALMIITTGGKRYQLFVSSDTQKNAKVIIEYEP